MKSLSLNEFLRKILFRRILSCDYLHRPHIFFFVKTKLHRRRRRRTKAKGSRYCFLTANVVRKSRLPQMSRKSCACCAYAPSKTCTVCTIEYIGMCRQTVHLQSSFFRSFYYQGFKKDSIGYWFTPSAPVTKAELSRCS